MSTVPPPPPPVPNTPGSPYAGMPGLRPDGSRKGPTPWLGVGIFVVGFVMAMTALFQIVDRIEDFRQITAVDAPGVHTIDLVEGEWRLMRFIDDADVDPDAIEVTGPAPVRFRVVDSTDQFVEKRTFEDRVFREVAAFDIDADGAYRFDIGEDATTGADLIVVRATVSLIGSGVAIGIWGLVGLFGGFLLLVGLILAVVGFVTRHRANRSLAMINGYL